MNLKFINIGFLSISAHLLPYIDPTLIITQMDFMDFKITRISIRNDSHKKIFKNQLKFPRKIPFFSLEKSPMITRTIRTAHGQSWEFIQYVQWVMDTW